MVYRLVTANTFDQRIVERATSKRRLEKMVIHKGMYAITVNSQKLLRLQIVYRPKFTEKTFANGGNTATFVKVCVCTIHSTAGKFKGYSVEEQQLSLEDLASLLHSVDHQSVVDSGDAILSDQALAALLDRRVTGERGGELEGVFKVIHEQHSTGNTLPGINNGGGEGNGRENGKGGTDSASNVGNGTNSGGGGGNATNSGGGGGNATNNGGGGGNDTNSGGGGGNGTNSGGGGGNGTNSGGGGGNDTNNGSIVETVEGVIPNNGSVESGISCTADADGNGIKNSTTVESGIKNSTTVESGIKNSTTGGNGTNISGTEIDTQSSPPADHLPLNAAMDEPTDSETGEVNSVTSA